MDVPCIDQLRISFAGGRIIIADITCLRNSTSRIAHVDLNFEKKVRFMQERDDDRSRYQNKKRASRFNKKVIDKWRAAAWKNGEGSIDGASWKEGKTGVEQTKKSP